MTGSSLLKGRYVKGWSSGVQVHKGVLWTISYSVEIAGDIVIVVGSVEVVMVDGSNAETCA